MTAPSGYALAQAVATMQRALAEEADPTTGEIIDAAEATENVEELLARVLRAAVEAKFMADMAKERVLLLEMRQARYTDRYENLRATSFAAMDALGRKKVELPDLTASIKQNAARVVITDETLLPSECLRVTVSPDKDAIKAALSKGPVEGAMMSNSLPSISIRVR